MLAYVFYHWKRNEISAPDYEQRLRDFHRALTDAPSPGFSQSWCVSLAGAPWANEVPILKGVSAHVGPGCAGE